MSHRPIEPFHKGILIRLAGLNIPESDPTLRTPSRKAVGEEFRAIVEPNGLRLTTPGGHLLQHPNHSLGGQGGIDFDRQDFSPPFIQHIEGSESSPAGSRIAQEIHGPHRVRLRNDDERLAEPEWEPLLRPSREIQAELALHPPQPLIV